MDETMQAAASAAAPKKVDRERLMEIRGVHQKYLNGLDPVYKRVKACEEWFRLHNTVMQQRGGKVQIGKDGGFTAQSAWVFNTVTSKHADHVDACPTSECMPREPGDVQASDTLNKVLPCLLERFGWTQVWNNLSLRKVKLGTGHYKTFWDKDKEGGLGEVAIESVSTLNLAWQPTVTDIQKSEYIFQHEYVSRKALERTYPQIREQQGTPSTDHIEEFFTDQERRDRIDEAVLVECWYKVPVPTAVGTTRMVLHKILYTGDVVLYASEDDPNCAERGYYDHGMYPYVFDAMFALEDSACGLGYVDIGVNPQTAIDILNTAMVKNAAVGAVPRYMSAQGEATIDESELLDTSKAIVHVKNGTIDEKTLREMPHKSLDGNYIAVRDGLIQEMRETTGNTETSTGSTGSGVTAASAIAALQEASGKISRAAISASYAAFAKVMEQVIELIRQFYTPPRYARITGKDGKMEFVQLSTMDMSPGGRRATFDISVKATRLRSFDRVAHNELALQFYGLGFFNPQKAEEALMCIEMMDFPGKDTLRQKIAEQATMHKTLVKYMQLSLALARRVDPAMAEVIGQEIVAFLGEEAGAQMVAQKPALPGQEAAGVSQARERAQGVSQPAA